MKKIILTVFIISVSVILGLFVFKNGYNKEPVPGINPIDQRTIKDLLAEGTPQKCVYNKKFNRQSVLEATLYFSGQNLRGDIVSPFNDGTKINSHFIVKDNFSYLWNDKEDVAFKFDLSKQDYIAPVGKDASENLNLIANFTCQRKPVENSLFALPQDKEFKAPEEQ